VTVVKCGDEMNSADDLLWVQETEGSRVITWNKTYPFEPLCLPTSSVGVPFCSRISAEPSDSKEVHLLGFTGF
jgi:hypothetical protein